MTILRTTFSFQIATFGQVRQVTKILTRRARLIQFLFVLFQIVFTTNSCDETTNGSCAILKTSLRQEEKQAKLGWKKSSGAPV
jgi:hypothetical protein